jgi:SAM-dependent methyltransferase
VKGFSERTACPACDAGGAREVLREEMLSPGLAAFLADSRDYAELETGLLREAVYSLMRCGECGLYYQRFVPDAELMQRLYSSWVDPEASLAKEAGLPFWEYAEYAREVMVFLALAGERPGRLRALDYGMGWGHWCLMARAFGLRAWGLELSEHCRAHARSHGLPLLEEHELPDREFDLVRSNQVIEHLGQPRRALERIHRTLKPGGWFLVDVPDCGRLARRLRAAGHQAGRLGHKTLKLVQPLQHVNGFDHGSLSRLARMVGFRPVRIPLGVEYACFGTWLPASRLPWKAWRPLHRRLLNPGTHLWLQKP